jgi:signal transduction histidine kinase
VGSAQTALGELRDLAHGIHPAILTQAGLGPALATLAESAPLPVEIGDVTEGRYPASAEIAAYRTVVEALSDAAQRGATHVAISAREGGHRLTVEVSDDGAARTSGMIRLLDRVGALGGRLDVSPTMVRAEIPCG